MIGLTSSFCPMQIWDVHGSGKCMQTYMGHSKAVRDVTFNNTGTRFLSARSGPRLAFSKWFR